MMTCFVRLTRVFTLISMQKSSKQQLLISKISKTSKMTVSFLLEMMYVSVWSTD